MGAGWLIMLFNAFEVCVTVLLEGLSVNGKRDRSDC